MHLMTGSLYLWTPSPTSPILPSPIPCLWQPSICSLNPWVCILFILDSPINEIMQYLSFSVWYNQLLDALEICAEVCPFLYPLSCIVLCVKVISLHFPVFCHFGYLLSRVPSSTGCFFPRKCETEVILPMRLFALVILHFCFAFYVSTSFCTHWIMLFQCWLW